MVNYNTKNNEIDNTMKDKAILELALVSSDSVVVVSSSGWIGGTTLEIA